MGNKENEIFVSLLEATEYVSAPTLANVAQAILNLMFFSKSESKEHVWDSVEISLVDEERCAACNVKRYHTFVCHFSVSSSV